MAKRNNYSNKRSEYRINYLPFDYYDFWITAKENENLRFKNKLRDYLHTPFDWDENLEVYRESQEIAMKFEKANQATQTSDRPNRHDQLKMLLDEKEELARKHIQVSNLEKSVQTSQGKKWCKKQMSSNNQTKHQSGNKKSKEGLVNSKKHIRPTKSASIQVNLDSNNKRNQSSTAVTTNVNRQRSRSARNLRNQSSIKLEDNFGTGNKANEMVRSMSNMSIQTPMEWNLRDYSRTSMKSGKNKRPIRSASVLNLQPKRPPFANYGWAVKTKDLSLKPTHNALANKILAVKYHDGNAISELKMQRIKKDATLVANEYLAAETKSLDRFRSDSRDWHTEYDQKYWDYTKSGQKQDLYFSLNPNRLKKSALLSEQQDLASKRGDAKKHNSYYNFFE